jgi:hypothetical protein
LSILTNPRDELYPQAIAYVKLTGQKLVAMGLKVLITTHDLHACVAPPRDNTVQVVGTVVDGATVIFADKLKNGKGTPVTGAQAAISSVGLVPFE